jgi:hypothetical protein
MDSAAALVPSATDRGRIFRLLAAWQKHNRALRMANWFSVLRSTIA